jgi:L-threonylcarbamoyladenylate synthase
MRDKTALVQSADSIEAIKSAAELIRSGELVVFPTETVYGLGADATNDRAVAKIFEAKGRPKINPLIVHLGDKNDLEKYTKINSDIERVVNKYWPGPLTIIAEMRESCSISRLCSAGLSTIALRVPSHPTARELLRLSNVPIAAPSANTSGRLSPTAPVHVIEDSLADKVSMILASGSCQVGLESTILDMSEDNLAILRPGAISEEEIEALVGKKVENNFIKSNKPKSPGQLLKHYAPKIPLRLNAIDLEPGEALLAFGSDKFMGIKGGGRASDLPSASRKNLSEEGDLTEAASNLFKMLHDLDNPEHKGIAVMNIPDIGLGIAINDRLSRAACSKNNKG